MCNVQRCPVCLGTGQVARMYEGSGTSVTNPLVTCHGCGGSSWVTVHCHCCGCNKGFIQVRWEDQGNYTSVNPTMGSHSTSFIYP